jgi:hypothetical protein
MTRTSTAILQTLIIAIFISSMIFFSLAISRESKAMPGMSSYEAMSVPGPRTFSEDPIVLLPSEGRRADAAQAAADLAGINALIGAAQAMHPSERALPPADTVCKPEDPLDCGDSDDAL